MDRSRPRRIRSARHAVSMLVLCTCVAAVSGCATVPPEPHPVAIDTKRALVDSYLIAHGMALGYGRSGRAGPAEITQLIRFDHAAMIAVANAAFTPGSAHTRQAQTAVGDMLRYTSTQDLSGVPAADALSDAPPDGPPVGPPNAPSGSPVGSPAGKP